MLGIQNDNFINWTITTDPEELDLPTKTEQKAKQ